MKNQKRFLIYFISGILMLTIFSCSKDDDDFRTYSDIELEILKLINEHRSSIEKAPLTMDKFIFEQATKHTNYMIDLGDINHDGFSDRSTLIRETLGGSGTAENVAYGYSSAKAVVNGWLNSSGHKKNIEGEYTLTGISAIKNDKGTYYYTQIFLNK